MTRMPKGRVCWFADAIYRSTYFVVCTPDTAFVATVTKLLRTTNLSRAQQQGVLRALGDSPLDQTHCNGRTYRLAASAGAWKKDVIIVWIRPDADITVWVHEGWHAIRYVLDGRGLDLSHVSSEEAVAYYFQWWLRQALGYPA